MIKYEIDPAWPRDALDPSKLRPDVELKLLCVEMWPHGNLNAAVIKIMDYYKEDYIYPSGRINNHAVMGYCKSLGFGLITRYQISAYLATHFPRTSELLFSGATKEVARMAIMREKMRNGSYVMSRKDKNERKKENSLGNRTLTVRARSLSKDYDWGTVK